MPRRPSVRRVFFVFVLTSIFAINDFERVYLVFSFTPRFAVDEVGSPVIAWPMWATSSGPYEVSFVACL